MAVSKFRRFQNLESLRMLVSWNVTFFEERRYVHLKNRDLVSQRNIRRYARKLWRKPAAMTISSRKKMAVSLIIFSKITIIVPKNRKKFRCKIRRQSTLVCKFRGFTEKWCQTGQKIEADVVPLFLVYRFYDSQDKTTGESRVEKQLWLGSIMNSIRCKGARISSS